MLGKKVFVVTNPELGWDCVVDVYSKREHISRRYNRPEYQIFEKTITQSKSSKNKNKSYVK